MARLLLILLMVCSFALPAVAELATVPQTSSEVAPVSEGETTPQTAPHAVETLPFSAGHATLNTNTIMTDDGMVAAEGETAGHDSAHGDAGLPQFNTTTFSSQIFWLAVSFTILYVFFSRTTLPKISSAIEDRITTIKTDLDMADAISADAEKTKLSYEQAMSGAHEDARAHIQTTVTELRAQAEAEANAFREKSEAEILKLQKQADMAKEKIKGELADVAYSLTHQIVTKLTDLDIDAQAIQKAVMDCMETTNAGRSEKKIAA